MPATMSWPPVYLISVFYGAHPQSSTSLRNSRELRTIADCIDALLAGDLFHLGDLFLQRLKAVQTAVVEGNWNLAQHLNSYRPQEAMLSLQLN